MILFAYENQRPFSSWVKKDETIADYMGKLFVEGAGPERRSYLLGGPNLVQPSSSFKLPIASLCLLAWAISHVGGEGGPMAEAVFELMGDGRILRCSRLFEQAIVFLNTLQVSKKKLN